MCSVPTQERYFPTKDLLSNCLWSVYQIRLLPTRSLSSLVSPLSLSASLNDITQEDRSIFFYDDDQSVNISCEIYSYPKSTLQIRLDNQTLPSIESIDCFNDDHHSTLFLSDSSCLSQTNWRIRVRRHTSIKLSLNHSKSHLTCLVNHFPYGISWHLSITIEFHRQQSNFNRYSLGRNSSPST